MSMPHPCVPDRLIIWRIALQHRRRDCFETIERLDAQIAAKMAQAGEKAVTWKGFTLKAVRGTIRGSPSQRKRWRKLCPDGAYNQWEQPMKLQITERKHYA